VIDPVRLEVYRHRFAAVAEEMGEALRRASFSPNIKERRDYSCAVFDARGDMVAQATHIPVHLGSMPLSVAAAIEEQGPDLGPGDMVLLNDPYRGGTHLPDLTLVAPVFDDAGALAWFVASRAHHADVGGMTPGSLPISREIYQEGLRIPPVRLVRGGAVERDLVRVLLANCRAPEEREGDLLAQVAANRLGGARLLELERGPGGAAEARLHARALLDYAERLMRAFLRAIPDGEYAFEDFLEDDGAGSGPLAVRVAVRIAGGEATVDFSGTAPQCRGCLNANEAIALSATAYAFRAVAGAGASGAEAQPPPNAGALRPIRLVVPEGSLVAPRFPAAVAGGNVETSQRLVDVLLGALAAACPDRVPAASAGSMSNLTVGGVDPGRGGRTFAYYETVGGGAGASPRGKGASGIQTHMTNTRNTPVEVLEHAYPFRVRQYRLRPGSGGAGAHPGGDGIVRELVALAPCEATLLTERRRLAPYGLAGGAPGAPGRNGLVRADGSEVELPAKATVRLEPGDAIRVETPGGGGFGGPTAP